MNVAINIVKHALLITVFVAVMMLVIEYLNILTNGEWQKRFLKNRWGKYLLAALLGATPGCLGVFAVVTMCSHKILPIGAVITAMITTTGDEAFVMLSMIPKDWMIITGILFLIGIIAGALIDLVAKERFSYQSKYCDDLKMHEADHCVCFPKGYIIRQWKECSFSRGILAIGLVLFIVGLIIGEIGPQKWNWIRITLLIVSSFSLFVISTVPDHFLEEHIWRHVVQKHVPRIFFWTLGALVTIHVLTKYINLEGIIRENLWLLLLIACLVGLIPESGPHIVFVTLYAKGSIPLSILLASSLVQDGHGMLPILADSRRAFLEIKAINFIGGILLGVIGIAFGL